VVSLYITDYLCVLDAAEYFEEFFQLVFVPNFWDLAYEYFYGVLFICFERIEF